MEITENQIIKNYAKHCGHCNQNTLLELEYDWTCVSCIYNVIKRKHELSKVQPKRKNINQLLKM